MFFRSVISVNTGLVVLTVASYLFPQMRYVSYGLGLCVIVGGGILGLSKRTAPFGVPVIIFCTTMGVATALTGVVGAYILPYVVQHGLIFLKGVKRVYELGYD